MNNILLNAYLWSEYLLKISLALLFISIPIQAMNKNNASPQIVSSSKQINKLVPHLNDRVDSLTITASGNKKSCVNDNRNNYSPTNNNVITLSFLGISFSKLIDPELYKNIWLITTDFGKFVANTLNNHRKAAFLSFAGSLYIMLNARLMYLQNKLNYPNCWSEWRSNLTLEELYSIPQQTLYNDLLTNIQTKYTNFKNFRDHLAPLSNFLEEVELEENYIRQYDAIAKALKLLHINNFTFYNRRLYKRLDNRLKKLLFLKNTFLNWHAERKLNNSEKELLFRRFPSVKKLLNDSQENHHIDIALIPPLQPEESTEFILENIIKI